MIVKNLPACLKIEDDRLFGCLQNIETTVKRIWDESFIKHYTSHRLDHSERIFQMIGQLLEEHKDLLNEHEKFILSAAILTHDIGMQSPKHAGLPTKEAEAYTIADMELVREIHHETSKKMIKEIFSKKSNGKLEIDICNEYAEYIGDVSLYHRKLNLNDLEDFAMAGETIRLRLLAALIRLGDELDHDYRRVNLEILKLQGIPSDSKFHWWAHHYVSSIIIKSGKIMIYFRFPGEYKDSNLAYAFKTKVFESIKVTFLEVYDILDINGLRLYKDITVKDVRFSDG